MDKFYFFTDAESLDAQTADQAYGPVKGSEKTQYRVTSLHTAMSDVNAYAVCDGTVWAQYSDDGYINIVLRPTVSPDNVAYPVKYYVYKGINSDSVVDNANTGLIKDVEMSGKEGVWSLLHVIKESQIYRDREYDRMMGYAEGTSRRRTPVSAIGLDLTASSQDAPISDTDFIDKAFQIKDRDQFPQVSAGAVLGVFNPDSIGFEIIVNSVGGSPAVRTCRNTETVIICDTNAAPESFIGINDREKILNYTNPCSFYSSFFAASSKSAHANDAKTNLYAYDSKRKSIPLTNSTLYNVLTRCFSQSGKVYIDIRNEHNHSLDYYKHYGSEDSFAQIGCSWGDDAIEYLNYETYGWPVLILQIPDGLTMPNGQATTIPLSLQFPVNGNAKPMIYINSGYYDAGYPNTRNRFLNLSESVNTDNSGYTVPAKFAVPCMPGFAVSMRYLKRICTVQPESDYEIYAGHYIDNLFELTQLANEDGLIIQHPSNPVKWSMLDIRSFVNEEAGYGSYYMADIGAAEDLSSVCLFAVDKKEKADSNFVRQDAADIESVFSRFAYVGDSLNVDHVQLPDGSNVNVGRMDLLPDEVFDAVMSGEFHVPDGRSLIALFITKNEFDRILEFSALFAAGYDRRLTLKRHDVKFTYDGKEYQQYSLLLRGYKYSGDGLTVTEEDTDIIITRSTNDCSRFFFSNGYMADKMGIGKTEKNWNDFYGSFLLPGVTMNLRKTPNDDDDSNIITHITGKIELRILGKLQVKAHTWYCVEWDASKLGTNVNRGWIRAGIDDDASYDHDVYITASLNRFIKDLDSLNKELDLIQQQNEGWSIDNTIDRITRLRQRSHAKWQYVDIFECDWVLDLIGYFLDKVIGSSARNPDPVYLDDIDYDGGIKESVEINGVQTDVDTNIQLFLDYMGVRLDNGLVIDLFHLFVGLDVLNHENLDTSSIMQLIDSIYSEYAYLLSGGVHELLLQYMRRITELPRDIGSNVDAATWIGDIGSVAADYVSNETSGNTIEYYYSSRASDVDIISDIIPHIIIYAIQLKLYMGNGTNRYIEPVLWQQLCEIQSGSKLFKNKFSAYLKNKTLDDLQSDVYKFSMCWYVRSNYSRYLIMDDERAEQFRLHMMQTAKIVYNRFIKQLDVL